LRSLTKLTAMLREEGLTTKLGAPMDKGYLYRVLQNRVVLGEVVHKGSVYPGEHEAIIDRKLWDKAHAIMRDDPRKRAAGTRARTPALLKGLIFGPTGAAFTPTHTRRKGKLYRYYVSTDTLKRGMEDTSIGRLPAAEIEAAVVQQIRILLRAPEMVVRTWRTARRTMRDLTEADVRDALERFDALWEELFPAEQSRIVQLLVERIDVVPGAADIRLRADGLTSLLQDMQTASTAREAA
jgi:hypothetical protein